MSFVSVKPEGSSSKTQRRCSEQLGQDPVLILKEEFWKTLNCGGNMNSGTLLPECKSPLCHFLDWCTGYVLFSLTVSQFPPLLSGENSVHGTGGVGGSCAAPRIRPAC